MYLGCGECLGEEVYGNDYREIIDDFIKADLKLENIRISQGSENLNGYWQWKSTDTYLSLSHESIASIEMTTQQYAKLGMLDAAGIGWMLDHEYGIVWHNDGTSNFNSYVGFDKKKQIAVVILANLAPNYRIPATVMGARLMATLQAESVQ
mgnify:CR=1 FL=1